MGNKLRQAFKPDGSYHAWMFLCPACDDLHVLTTWQWNGSREAPTFTPSILVRYFESDAETERARCHSYVTDGKIIYLSDCSHLMAGQTTELPDMEDVSC